ncbi:hypothetical protein K4K48_000377 [Colletotrichum sp. SAR 10_66]|nr:hypothetical protein K4K48_000377 [Colletotrichum sp. SAR 10_66]
MPTQKWFDQQVAIDYQKPDLLRQELDRIFGKGRHRIKAIKWDYFHLVLPRRLSDVEIGTINQNIQHYKTQSQCEAD